jgi:hypothetical protein
MRKYKPGQALYNFRRTLIRLGFDCYYENGYVSFIMKYGVGDI